MTSNPKVIRFFLGEPDSKRQFIMLIASATLETNESYTRSTKSLIFICLVRSKRKNSIVDLGMHRQHKDTRIKITEYLVCSRTQNHILLDVSERATNDSPSNLSLEMEEKPRKEILSMKEI